MHEGGIGIPGADPGFLQGGIQLQARILYLISYIIINRIPVIRTITGKQH
jgi:hypothetical protein